MTNRTLLIAAAAATALLTAGFSRRPIRADEPPYIKVDGVAEVGAQCPDDYPAKLAEIPLSLWDGPRELKKLELKNKVIQQLTFTADCINKVIGLSSGDSTLDSTWSFSQTDGSFYVQLGGGGVHFKEDGAGTKDCVSYVATDIWGKVNCNSPVSPVIRVEVAWLLGQGRPAPDDRDRPRTAECRFPPKAFIYTGAEIHQCRE